MQKCCLHKKTEIEPSEKPEALSAFIRENFQMTATNISKLEDAEIICLGECHDENKHCKNIATIIDATCGANDLVLVEADDKFSPGWSRRSEQLKYVKKPLKILGWDVRKGPVCAELELARTEFGIYHSLFTKTFRKLFSFANYRAIERLTRAEKAYEKDFLERNLHMRRVIDENHSKMEPGSKIYVIAGMGHLAFIKDDNFSRENVLAVRKIHSYVKTKKFMILIANDQQFKPIASFA